VIELFYWLDKTLRCNQVRQSLKAALPMFSAESSNEQSNGIIVLKCDQTGSLEFRMTASGSKLEIGIS